MPVFNFDGFELEEAPENAVPICPSCQAELHKVRFKAKGISGLAQKQVLMCPHCRAFLGYGMERA